MPPQPRVALDELKRALDAHLSACERRIGEEDPAVQQAYSRVRETAEAYDDVLFDAFDEVTPFEFSAGPTAAQGGGAGFAEQPSRIGVFLRRDYRVADLAAVLAAGASASAETSPEGVEGMQGRGAAAAGAGMHHLGLAVYRILHAAGVDGLDEQAEDIGLQPQGGTVWLVALDEDDNTIYDEPFEDVDVDRLVYRLDEVFEG